MNKQHIQKCIKDYELAQVGVAERLRVLRTSKGLTQGQLGELAGSNQAVIQKIEMGKSMRPRCLSALAAVLGVNPAWLAWGDAYASPALITEDL